MSRYLLDTDVLLRILMGDVDKNSPAYAALNAKDAQAYVSAANVLEVAIKKAMKHVKVPNDFTEALRKSGFEILDISAEHAWKTVRLPFHHADAHDRLLIAQAMCEDLTLVTSDSAFDAYAIRILRA